MSRARLLDDALRAALRNSLEEAPALRPRYNPRIGVIGTRLRPRGGDDFVYSDTPLNGQSLHHLRQFGEWGEHALRRGGAVNEDMLPALMGGIAGAGAAIPALGSGLVGGAPERARIGAKEDQSWDMLYEENPQRMMAVLREAMAQRQTGTADPFQHTGREPDLFDDIDAADPFVRQRAHLATLGMERWKHRLSAAALRRQERRRHPPEWFWDVAEPWSDT